MSGRVRMRSDTQGGFVLVAVLAMLVILALLAGTIAQVAQRVRDDQFERQRLFRDEIAMVSTRATLVYLLTSQRMTLGGLTVDQQVVLTDDQQRELADEGGRAVGIMPVGTEIRLDGSPHVGLWGVHFALQDDRGLLGVNWAPPALLERWLDNVSDAPVAPMATLSNLLADYQDADALYRLNSAEAPGYAEAGLPPPSNQTLATPLELRRVIGWREALAGVPDSALVDMATVSRTPLVNVNTAPAEVLASLPGVDPATARRVVDARTLLPFSTRAAFADFAGPVAGGGDLVSLYPSMSGILKLWSPRGGAVQVLHWTLTPLDDGGRPWREDYEFTLPQDGRLDAGAPRTVASPLFAEPVAPAE